MTMIAFENAPSRGVRLSRPAVLGLARRLGAALAAWWATRTAGAYDDAFFKDVGVPRCGFDHAVRHGRDL